MNPGSGLSAVLRVNGQEYFFYPLLNAPGATIEALTRLPYSIRILLEAACGNPTRSSFLEKTFITC
jgi:hypothetical protein